MHMQLILGRGDQGIAEGETKPVFDGVGLIDGMSAAHGLGFFDAIFIFFQTGVKNWPDFFLGFTSKCQRTLGDLDSLLSTSLSKWACRVPVLQPRPYKGLVRAAASPTAK